MTLGCICLGTLVTSVDRNGIGIRSTGPKALYR